MKFLNYYFICSAIFCLITSINYFPFEAYKENRSNKINLPYYPKLRMLHPTVAHIAPLCTGQLQAYMPAQLAYLCSVGIGLYINIYDMKLMLTLYYNKKQPGHFLDFALTIFDQSAILDLELLPYLVELGEHFQGQAEVLYQLVALLYNYLIF